MATACPKCSSATRSSSHAVAHFSSRRMALERLRLGSVCFISFTDRDPIADLETIPDSAAVAWSDEGRVRIIDLATGAVRAQLSGRTSSGFGFSVSAIGDVNGDGVDDLLTADPNVFTGDSQRGQAYVLSGNVVTSGAGWTPIDSLPPGGLLATLQNEGTDANGTPSMPDLPRFRRRQSDTTSIARRMQVDYRRGRPTPREGVRYVADRSPADLAVPRSPNCCRRRHRHRVEENRRCCSGSMAFRSS
jgi:hypothetical protein